MFRTDAEGNVGGMYDPGDPFIPRPATIVTHEHMNAIQEEIVGVILASGVTLNKADNTQLLTALNAKYGRLDLANTWAGNQSVGGTLSVTGNTSLGGSLAVTATSTFTGLVTANGGATFNGVGSGAGAVFKGGPTAGPGATFEGGTGNAYGSRHKGSGNLPGLLTEPSTPATASTPQTALYANAGYIQFMNAPNPNSNVALTNTLTPANILRAKATVQTGSGGSVIDGFNIASAAPVFGSDNRLRVTFAAAMPNANYGLTWGAYRSGEQIMAIPVVVAAGYVEFLFYNFPALGGALESRSASTHTMTVWVMVS